MTRICLYRRNLRVSEMKWFFLFTLIVLAEGLPSNKKAPRTTAEVPKSPKSLSSSHTLLTERDWIGPFLAGLAFESILFKGIIDKKEKKEKEQE